MKIIIEKEVKNAIIRTVTKAALLFAGASSFMMPGNEASWLPLINMVLMGWMYIVLKSNLESF